MPTVKETFEQMSTKFQPSKATGVNAVIQYEITGDGGGTWHAVIKDSTCTVKEGAAPSPTATLTLAASDWLGMIGGQLSGQMLFMSGKLKPKGDMGLLMKLPSLFSM
jgi:putative sterol carrier protein